MFIVNKYSAWFAHRLSNRIIIIYIYIYIYIYIIIYSVKYELNYYLWGSTIIRFKQKQVCHQENH